MRRFAIASILAFAALAARSAADEQITLDLPSSRPPVQASASGANGIAAPGQQQKSARAFQEYSRRRALASSAGATTKYASRGRQTAGGTKQYTVGRLGVATRTAPIRAGRSSSRMALSKIKSGTYVALNSENGAWYGVLMADRTTGWVKKSDVKMLAYEVVSNRPADAGYTGTPNYQQAMMDGRQRTVIEIAQTYLGVPYKWGGTAASGLDCSAFVQRCFSNVGIRLPRTAREQIAFGVPVSADQLQAADRVYFQNSSGAITHTGIYLGGGYFIHASSRHKGVAVSRLDESLYTRMYAGARR